MKNSNKKSIISMMLVLVLVVGCFAALPITANAASTPVAGTPAWNEKYSAIGAGNTLDGGYYDRGNAAGDKISSNAHSADYPGVYFRWDEKQKCPGVFLVEDWVFDLFVDETFYLTAKNSNSYYKYTISRSTGVPVDDDGNIVYVYGIPKEVMGKDNKGKDVKDQLKNINMVFIDGTYKSAWIVLAKTWLDEDGCLVWKPFENIALNKEIAFSNGLKLGVNEEDFCEIKITDFTTATKGKTIDITETKLPADYEFKCAQVLYGNGKPIKDGVALTVKPGDKAAVLFMNQKQKAEITIAKIWFDCAAPEGGATYQFNGDNNVVPGTYPVKEGCYTIVENQLNGYELISVTGVDSFDLDEMSATINVKAGQKYTVTFTNRALEEPSGDRNLRKTVDGIEFTTWIEKHPDINIDDVIDGMSFELYKAIMVDGTPMTFTRDGGSVTSGKVDSNGFITFEMTPQLKSSLSGWYLVGEVLTGAAEDVFKTPATDILVYFGANGQVGFDDKAFYTIVNGYGWEGSRILGYPGLNNDGDLFYIGVTNSATGEEYVSFCGNAGSRNFAGDNELGCTGYLISTDELIADSEIPVADLLSAFNYIIDNYGDLNENRAITQTVIWALLGAVNVHSYDFAKTNLSPEEKCAVRDVMKNYKDYTGSGNVVEVFFLVCENPDHGFYTCQPQIVPIYNYSVDNKMKTLASLSFEKKVEGKNIVCWLKQNYPDEAFDILEGLEFYLDVDGDYKYGPVSPDVDGNVVFKDVIPGKYTLSERITDAAIGIFNEMLDVEITIAEGEDNFFVLGGTIKGFIDDNDIEPGDLFTVFNGYGNSFNWGYYEDGIHYPGLNGGGHVFYISVTNTRTDQVLDSYCANAGSSNFAEGEAQYLIGHRLNEERAWIQAFNYIYDNYGDLNDNRVITQVITWALLDAVDVYNLDITILKDEEKEAIIDVWENYEGYVGSGTVVDVLFMTSIYDNYPDNYDFSSRQPQIVPIFGTFYVQNEPVE